MKNNRLLLPYRFKKLGWILTIPSFLAGLWVLIWEPEIEFLTTQVFAFFGEDGSSFFGGDPKMFVWMTNNLLDELISVTLMAGLLLLSFTREKQEDEYIGRIRQESMYWAVFTQMMVFIGATLTIYGTAYWTFMLVNLFTLPLFFVLRYYFMKIKLQRQV